MEWCLAVWVVWVSWYQDPWIICFQWCRPVFGDLLRGLCAWPPLCIYPCRSSIHELNKQYYQYENHNHNTISEIRGIEKASFSFYSLSIIRPSLHFCFNFFFSFFLNKLRVMRIITLKNLLILKISWQILKNERKNIKLNKLYGVDNVTEHNKKKEKLHIFFVLL